MALVRQIRGRLAGAASIADGHSGGLRGTVVEAVGSRHVHSGGRIGDALAERQVPGPEGLPRTQDPAHRPVARQRVFDHSGRAQAVAQRSAGLRAPQHDREHRSGRVHHGRLGLADGVRVDHLHRDRTRGDQPDECPQPARGVAGQGGLIGDEHEGDGGRLDDEEDDEALRAVHAEVHLGEAGLAEGRSVGRRERDDREERVDPEIGALAGFEHGPLPGGADRGDRTGRMVDHRLGVGWRVVHASILPCAPDERTHPHRSAAGHWHTCSLQVVAREHTVRSGGCHSAVRFPPWTGICVPAGERGM
jgi:hypothetical protein